MNSSRISLGVIAGAAVALGTAFTWSAAPPTRPDSAGRVSVAEARERAKLMHEIHSATLETMHHYYFRGDRATVPARAMEEVFAEINRASKIETRWIAVNTRAMSISHKPETEFEKEAAAELASGKPAFDRVVKGTYHRAAVIPLGPGCVNCHTRFDAPRTKKPRVAGLVISIPVKDD